MWLNLYLVPIVIRVALALFCVVIAILYHPFWKFAVFWKPGDSNARGHFWDFLKNFGLARGLLLITFGTLLAPLGTVARHPLGSTTIYTPAETAASAPNPTFIKEDSKHE